MRIRRVFWATVLGICLFGLRPAEAAQLTKVDRAKWVGNLTLPSYLTMYIYVPDQVASNPPIVVSSHSCGSTAQGQMGNNTNIKAAADKNGFIMVLPDNPGQNCWDVGTDAALKHNGGSDTQGVVQMVKYALTTYNGDAKRVYALGGSSGAMMTQALMAVYPDVFRAGAARAGVPAGCWADGYAASNQWSNSCSGGNTIKTAQQWGDLVRAMFPGYTGHRPRVQIFHGAADETISYKNFGEAIKEWTNVLGLSTTPSSTDSKTTSVATYDRQFWKNSCGSVVFEAWSGQGGKHSMAYEEADILRFFGLTAASDPDPEPDCTGDGGVVSTDGAAGGTTGSGGDGGVKDGGAGGSGGAGGRDGGYDAAGASGGTQASAGSTGSSSASSTGGGSTGGSSTGGSTVGGSSMQSGGSSGSRSSAGGGGGSSAGGSSSASGGGSGAGGSSSARSSGGAGGAATATTTTTTTNTGSKGGGCALGGRADGLEGMVWLVVVGLLFLRRRARR